MSVSGILHVCRANRARSPLAELATRELLALRGAAPLVPVSSAGTWTPGGEPLWPPAAAEARARGWDADSFRSRRLTRDLVGDADLVLAATRDLRDEVIALAPFALRRTFTWRELAWLCQGLSVEAAGRLEPGERLAALPARMIARRGHLPVPAGPDLDVLDPVDQDPSYLPRAVDLITAALRPLVEQLT